MISRRTVSSLVCASPALVAQLASAQTQPPAPSAPASDWQETWAYTLGMQAYVFGFPWIYLSSLRWRDHRPVFSI